MGKKRAAPVREEKRTAAEYYRLNTQAVEDLVTADASNSPEVSEEELRKYRSGSKWKMPGWVKIVLIKAWFAGSTFFFFIFGLGGLIHPSDLNLITGVALGFVIDILLNNLLRFMEKTPGANDHWLFVSKKGFISLPLNVLYGVLLMSCAMLTYQLLNTGLHAILGTAPMEDGSLPVILGAEPITFGIFAMCWDALFLLMKRTFKRIVADAKRTVKS